MSIKTFPYSLVRYAGLHHHNFDQLKLKQTEHLIAYYQKCLAEKEELKTTVCNALFSIINKQTDDKLRQQLINVKRRIFNDKKILEAHLILVENMVSDSLIKYFKSYLFKVAAIESFFQENTTAFNHAQKVHRTLIQQMILKPELQNGLMLSSPVLYEQLTDFIKQDVSHFKQKELRMEFSLLRYLTRMAFKTSPFSSFTYTGLMSLTSIEPMEKSSNVNQVVSCLKLNNILFEYLCLIIRQHPVLNGYLLLKVNITAETKGDKIHFLTNFNNIESFQQLKANGLQGLVLQYLKEIDKPVSLNNLIKHLLSHLDMEDDGNIKSYLIKLMDIGLFDLGIGVSGMDQNWDQKLLLFLQSMESEGADVFSLINLFKMLQKHRDEYAVAEPSKRYLILQDSERLVNEVFAQLQREAGLPYYTSATEKKITAGEAEKSTNNTFFTNVFVPYYFSARNIFYEDCFIAEQELCPAIEIQNFVSKVNELATHLIPLDVMRQERNKMRDFFLKHYQKGQQVALTTFYKDYYLHVKKPEKEMPKNEDQALFNINAWKAAVLVKLERENIEGEMFDVTSKFFSDLPIEPFRGLNSSLGVFVQFYHSVDNDGLYGVINSLLPGMGKVSGRFLTLFDQHLSEAFIAHNETLHPKIIKAELNDASTFNANIHPALLKHELALPSGNNIYPKEAQINVGHLNVCYDDKTNALTLFQQNSQIYCYDLSLESFYNRSNLYQLLAHFNPDARVSLQPFIQIIDQHYQNRLVDAEPHLFVLPRITYAKAVIIRRKTWRIKTDYIPSQQQKETDFEYFIRLNIWIRENKIPSTVFLFLRKRAYQIKPIDGFTEKREGLHDDYKPQYISFDQPLLICTFKRLLVRAGKYITLEEMLPEPGLDQVKEYLIQWYNS